MPWCDFIIYVRGIFFSIKIQATAGIFRAIQEV